MGMTPKFAINAALVMKDDGSGLATQAQAVFSLVNRSLKFLRRHIGLFGWIEA